MSNFGPVIRSLGENHMSLGYHGYQLIHCSWYGLRCEIRHSIHILPQLCVIFAQNWFIFRKNGHFQPKFVKILKFGCYGDSRKIVGSDFCYNACIGSPSLYLHFDTEKPIFLCIHLATKLFLLIMYTSLMKTWWPLQNPHFTQNTNFHHHLTHKNKINIMKLL